jgi:hypothetical protein
MFTGAFLHILAVTLTQRGEVVRVDLVRLADAVDALRSELTAARELGEDQPLLFEVGPVEVEVSAVVKRTGGGKAGFTIGVLTLSGQGTLGHEETHRVKVTLTPKDRITGAAPEINDMVSELPPN